MASPRKSGPAGSWSTYSGQAKGGGIDERREQEALSYSESLGYATWASIETTLH